MLKNLMEYCSILKNVIEFDGRLLNFSGDKKKHYCPQFGYQETLSKKKLYFWKSRKNDHRDNLVLVKTKQYSYNT